MFGVRILSVITAYTVILLEVYSGALGGPFWWVYPGALIIALLFGIAVYGASAEKNENSAATTLFQWIMMLGSAVAMSYFANYFGRELLPDIYAAAAQT